MRMNKVEEIVKMKDFNINRLSLYQMLDHLRFK